MLTVLRGDPFPELKTPPAGAQERLRARFMSFVVPEVWTGCWLWDGYVCKYGYGRFGRRGCSALAHRAAYELFRAPILGDLEVDHLCRIRWCVNPAHLELVTREEHILRTRLANARPARLRYIRPALTLAAA